MKKNIIYNIILTVSQLLFPLLTFPYITRIIGPEKLGAISFTQSFTQYFIIFATLGISIYGQREIAVCGSDIKKRSTIFYNMFTVHSIATFLFIILYVLSLFIFERLQENLLLFVVAIPHILFNIFSLEWFFQGMENFKYITIRSLICKVASVACIFLFVRDASDYLLYFIIIILSTIIPFVANIIYARNFLLFPKGLISIKSVWNSFLSQRHMAYYTIITSVYTMFPIIILGFMKTDLIVGNYTVSDKIYKVTLSMFGAINTVMLPRMSSLIGDNSRDKFNSILSTSFKLIVPLGLVAALSLFFLSDLLILLFSGDQYIYAARTLKILSPLLLILPIAQILVMQVLLPHKKEKQVLVFTITTAVLSILLNLYLVPKYSLYGTALSLLISEIVMTAMSLYYVVTHIFSKQKRH